MSILSVQQRLKPWMLPIAIVTGIFFHSAIATVQWLMPYLIFTMLFITFCRVRPGELKFSPMILKLLAVQVVGAIALFFVLRPAGLTLAQSAFLCVLCPTATAAPVVTGMLGGNIARVAAYSISSNLTVAILAPVLFVWFGGKPDLSFTEEFITIAAKVAPMIVVPMVAAFALYFFARPVHDAIDRVQGLSFYLWSVALVIVVGRAVSFMLAEPATAAPLMITMAVVAALVCVAQFAVGRKIGARYGDRISAAQGLGQKNTVLAIWMALTYLDPLSSVGPAAYIVWQNLINSWQLYSKMKSPAKVA